MSKRKTTTVLDVPGTETLDEFMERLPVPLTQEELNDRAAQLAKTNFDLADHALHEQQIKKQLNARKAELEAKRSELAGVVAAKREPREVRVLGVAFFAEGKYRCIRTDTGTVVPGSERDLRIEERQQGLGLGDKAPDQEDPLAAARLARAGKIWPELTGQNDDTPPEGTTPSSPKRGGKRAH